jgi:TonB-dependent starch-binding outer membrane protein SusC
MSKTDQSNRKLSPYSLEKTWFVRFFVVLLLSICLAPSFGQISIIGTVMDEDRMPLIGVTVKIKGTYTGTITNIDGIYNIQVQDTSSMLEYSYLGYLTQKVKIDSKREINIILLPDTAILEEVIYLGCTHQKKIDLTGALGSISSQDLTQNKPLYFDQSMQAKLAGVSVVAVTGLPGSNAVVRVRGLSSLNGSGGMPLYIVDGVRMSNINSIPPEDIESIDVLKDANLAAFYGGVSGGSGVILITTKKGKPGKTWVGFDFFYGMQTVPENSKADIMTGNEFEMTVNQMRNETGRSDYYDSTELANMPSTDWQDQIFQNAPVKSVNLTASGGTEKSTALMSINYMDQDGALLKCRFERFTVRVNTEFNPAKWLEVGENLSVVTTTRRGFQDWQLHNEFYSPISDAVLFQPNIEPYTYDAFRDKDIWNLSEWGNLENPLMLTDLINYKSNFYQAYGNAYAHINFTKWLKFDTKFGAEYNTSRSKDFISSSYYIVNGPPSVSRLNETISYFTSWDWQGYFTFQKTIIGSHNIALVGGLEYYRNYQEGLNMYADSFANEDYTQLFFDKGQNDNITVSMQPYELAVQSVYFRLNYDYKGKYLLNSNLRYDQSSLYGPNHNNDWFPSFSVGWKFSEEPFMRNLNEFSYGKIRFGWGQVGNDDISYGAYTATFSNPNVYWYSFNGSTNQQGYGPMNGSNYDMHWEPVNQTNLGIDLGFFDNKLMITADYFKKKNVGMLLSALTPGIAGQYIENAAQEGNPYYTLSNAGKMQNTGFEFSASCMDHLGKFSYDISANLTYIKTEVVDLAGIDYYGNTHRGMDGNLNYTVEGRDIAEFYGYEADGIFTMEDATWQDANGYGQEDGVYEWMVTNQPYRVDTLGFNQYAQPNARPGDIRFVEHELNDTLDANDQTWIGNPNPDLYAGLNIILGYGMFDLKMLVQGVFGNQIYNTMKVNGYNSSAIYNWQADFMDRYRDTGYDSYGNVLNYGNINGTIMRMDASGANGNYRNSSYFIEDGWYIRMKDLQVGFYLPWRLLNAIKFNKCRFYAGVQNLFTITEYTGLDPEIASSNPSNTNLFTKGIDIGTYPTVKTWYFGIQVGF